jgi:hypothetical protein
MTTRFQRLDAAESVFFARELEYIKAQTYDIKYPELKSRLFVPVSNEVPSGAVEVTYEQYDRVGRAKIIKPGATDSPRVDVNGTQFTRPVRWGSASYGWNLIDIRQARLAGKPLDARKAAACRRAQEELIDEVCAIGAPEYGIATGFTNNAGVTVQGVTGGVWSSATADDMITDITALWRNIKTDTKGMETPNTLLVPDAQYAIISTTPRSTLSDTTVLEFIRRALPELTNIEPWYRMEDAGVAGVDRAVMYRRDPMYLQQEISNEFEQLPVFQHGSNFEVETLVATAGCTFYYPKSARYLDGL